MAEGGIQKAETINYGFDDLVRTVTQNRKRALLIGLMAMFVAIVVMLVQGAKYTAEMALAIEQNDDSSAASSLGGFSPVLSSLIPSEHGEVFGIFLTRFTSEQVARALIKRHPGIIAEIIPEEFDEDGKTWKGPGPISGLFIDPVLGIFGYPPKQEPGPAELAEILQETITIVEPEALNIREVRFEHEDRAFATELLQILYFETNELIRSDQRLRALARVKYIEDQLQRVQVADHREALLMLLMPEQQKLLLLEEGNPLGLTLIQPPFSEPQPSSPRVFLGLIVSFILGFAAFIFFSVLFSEMKARRD